MPRELLFVSPRFLFPADSGGKIRTSQILRGMKGGAFRITLASPAPAEPSDFTGDIESVCDRFVSWPAERRGPLFPLTRLRHALSALPIPVATDRSTAASRVVSQELQRRPDVAVFDFAHSAVLAPPRVAVPTVMFTHNVESWIFRRHAEVARNPVMRSAWRSQWKKMERFERETLRRFDAIVAVSDQDALWFRGQYALDGVRVIPTGVDLSYFTYEPPGDSSRVVFTGSMDWMANQDGISFLLEEIWPVVSTANPAAAMQVVGRNPPASLVRRAAGLSWNFTGFVDDVRPYIRGGSVYVIPLRVGGGTRIKAFEAMAMGCPVVSTAIGVEGLPLEAGNHYLAADTPGEFAQAILRLLAEPEARARISHNARGLVEERYSSLRVAAEFERICIETAEARRDESEGYQQTPK